MTYQPPPPPPAAGPPARGQFDPKTVNPLDWAILGIGFLIFIFSFFAYYTWSAGPFSVSTSGWHFSSGTFIGWFAMVFGVAGAVAVALGLFMPTVRLPRSNRLVGLALFAASLLLYVIGLFAMGAGIGIGNHGFSYWLSLILAAGGLVVSLMRVQQTGEQLPGALANLPNIGSYGPQVRSPQAPPAAPPTAPPAAEPPPPLG